MSIRFPFSSISHERIRNSYQTFSFCLEYKQLENIKRGGESHVIALSNECDGFWVR